LEQRIGEARALLQSKQAGYAKAKEDASSCAQRLQELEKAVQ
jgi:hypothetical protein